MLMHFREEEKIVSGLILWIKKKCYNHLYAERLGDGLKFFSA